MVDGDVTFRLRHNQRQRRHLLHQRKLQLRLRHLQPLRTQRHDTALQRRPLRRKPRRHQRHHLRRQRDVSVIKGVVYMPDADLDMHGNPSLTLYADFVVHDIVLSGNVSFQQLRRPQRSRQSPHLASPSWSNSCDLASFPLKNPARPSSNSPSPSRCSSS